MIPQLPAYSVDKKESLKPGSSVARLDSAGIPSVEHTEANGESRDVNSSTKVTEATVQALKKPSRGFGALLGLPKKKFDTEKKDQEEKLEQIRSSVNLPFHSFAAKDEQPKAVVGEHSRVVEVSQSEEPLAVPASRSSAEDIILLDDNTNEEESSHDNLETTDPPRLDNSSSSALEVDEEDEPFMSLADLSTSFQKCFNASNKGKNEKAKKSNEPSGFLQLRPLDLEAARKQIRFGELQKEEQELVGDEGNKKTPVDSGDREKGSMVGTKVHKVNSIMLFRLLGMEVLHFAEFLVSDCVILCRRK